MIPEEIYQDVGMAKAANQERANQDLVYRATTLVIGSVGVMAFSANIVETAFKSGGSGSLSLAV